jgi:hypothetical protein
LKTRRRQPASDLQLIASKALSIPEDASRRLWTSAPRHWPAFPQDTVLSAGVDLLLLKFLVASECKEFRRTVGSLVSRVN